MLKNWEEKLINKITCADCLDILKEIPDHAIDLVLTDVPYNISQKSAGLRRLDYGQWDKQYGMELEWATAIMRLCRGTAIIWCSFQQWGVIEKIYKDNDFLTRPLIWHKPNPTVINCDKLYIQSTEIAVYAKRRCGYFAPSYKHNVFTFPFPNEREHPTQKPLPLFNELLQDTSIDNDLILDPFNGSGTTCVAAKMLGRRYIGIDISEEYCKIARERLEAVDTGVPVKEQRKGQMPLFGAEK